MGSVMEISRLFPDSILFGSLMLYVITQNLSYGIFSIFLLETSLLHKLVGFLFEKTKSSGLPKAPGNGIQCRPGFRMPRLEFERVFMSDNYPSVSILFMGAIASYLATASMTFTETLKSMGPDWQSRTSFSTVAILLLTMTFVLIRWLTGCDTLYEVMMALGIGLVAGVLFYMANYNLFGIEGVNFIGLPYLQDKTTTGTPLYICIPNSASGN